MAYAIRMLQLGDDDICKSLTRQNGDLSSLTLVLAHPSTMPNGHHRFFRAKNNCEEFYLCLFSLRHQTNKPLQDQQWVSSLTVEFK